MADDTVAHALSGAGGGVLSTVVTYPLITLSTRAQTEATRAKRDKAIQDEPDVNNTTNAFYAAKQIAQREGISGLYSGLESAIYGIGLTNFVYYYFYEGTKKLYNATESMSTLQTMGAGAIAGSATVIATNPIWVVNTRMTVKDNDDPDKTKKLSTYATIKDILEKDGVSAFFSGIGPALVLVINPIIQYTVFEQLKKLVEKRRKLSAWDAFFLGAFGKIIATSVTYPYITLKSRLQVRSDDKNKTRSNLIYGIKHILKEEGVSGLYNGISAKVLQSALTAAFLFFFKEQLYAVAVVVLSLLRNLRKRR